MKLFLCTAIGALFISAPALAQDYNNPRSPDYNPNPYPNYRTDQMDRARESGQRYIQRRQQFMRHHRPQRPGRTRGGVPNINSPANQIQRAPFREVD